MPPVLTIGALFFLHAFVIASWLTRLPDVITALAIDKGTMGLALFAAPIGSMLAAPLVARLIDRHAPGRVAVVSGAGVAAGLLLVAGSWNWVALAISLLVVGLVNGGIEVALNAAADVTEKALARPIMARCHGFWSVGFMTGALVAGLFAGADVDYRIQLPIVAVVVAAAFLGLLGRLPAPALRRLTPAPGVPKAPLFALPGRATAGICLMTIGVTLAEGAIYDWGTLYLREEIGATPFWSSAAYATYTMAMAVGRFSGDVVRAHVAAATIVRSCAAIAGAGLILLLAAPNLTVAAVALVLMGLGTSLVFPVAVSAISARGGASASANMAALSLSVMGALLLAPPAIGFVADARGLSTAFMLLLPLVAMTLLLAGQAGRTRARAEPLPSVGEAA